MATKSVFYSFHYDRDSWRVQQVMNIGAVEGQPLLDSQEWETVKRKGKAAVEQWIKSKMAGKSALVVLVGPETATREWVKYEIEHAWRSGIPMVGVRIHGLKNSKGFTAEMGGNPFSRVTLSNGKTAADYVDVHNPTGWNSQAVYADIESNLPGWVARAFKPS